MQATPAANAPLHGAAGSPLPRVASASGAGSGAFPLTCSYLWRPRRWKSQWRAAGGSARAYRNLFGWRSCWHASSAWQATIDHETLLRYGHIGVMDCYRNKSFEELRTEDYAAGRLQAGRGQQVAGVGPFGAQAGGGLSGANPGGGLLGANTDGPPAGIRHEQVAAAVLPPVPDDDDWYFEAAPRTREECEDIVCARQRQIALCAQSVALPTYPERVAIMYARVRKLGLYTEGVDLEVLARFTEGHNDADLNHFVNAALQRTSRRGADAVRMEHFASRGSCLAAYLQREGLLWSSPAELGWDH